MDDRGRRRHGWRGAAVFLIGTGALGGCGQVVPVAEFERAHGVAAPTQPPPERIIETFGDTTFGTGDRPPPEGLPREGAGGSASGGAAIGFGDGTRVADAALAELGGERTLVQVVLYEGYGIVISRGANGDLDRVVVRGGGAEGPKALPDAMVQDPEAARFQPTDVDWSMIPQLVARTPEDLGIEGGVVSHVIVEKNIPFTPDLVIRVYVSTERRSGRIDYFADGRPMRTFPG